MTKIKISDGKTKKIQISDGKSSAKTTPKKPLKKVTKIQIGLNAKEKTAKPAAAKQTNPVKQAKQVKKANAEILRQSKLAARLATREKNEQEKQARAAAKLAAKQKAEAKKQAQLAARLAAKQKAEKERQALIAKKRAKSAKPITLKKTTSDDKVLKSAMRNVATMDEPAEMPKKFNKKRRGRRIFLALLCSAATVSALVAFVHFNMPDLSVRVAAMQTGIEATYPNFIPRNYTLANVASEKDGEVTMYFNGPDGAGFSLSEENSTWDSTALLNNYVKKNYPSDFTTLREQGITIYVRGENASWVNGGILYKIHTTGKGLTKEQIRNIATSL
ncbi:hypothetical protein IKF40_02130 [Candidatus Saccharibacteria bacterium]|nr:hypothetical protein [Candidatus Saccharibacteria bacterium]